MFPILVERTPVRLDLSHSGWSDIFFLGMDFPEGARVLNISVDLGVHGRDAAPRPPIETRIRVIAEPSARTTLLPPAPGRAAFSYACLSAAEVVNSVRRTFC